MQPFSLDGYRVEVWYQLSHYKFSAKWNFPSRATAEGWMSRLQNSEDVKIEEILVLTNDGKTGHLLWEMVEVKTS